MPVTRKWAYLDHAAVAPLPQPTSQAIATWLREATEEGDTVWPSWAAQLEEARRLAAGMIGSDSSDIALIPNTTFGLNAVARGLVWQSGDNIVVPANEFPSNLYAWMSLESQGVETRRVPVENGRVDIQRLLAACDSRTRLISASWVGYASGWRINVAKLCAAAHEQGILVMLDAIQGLGVFPIDVMATGVDFLAADGHKWMLGPEGAGILYIRREHLDKLQCTLAGWNSVVQRFDYLDIAWRPRSEAARYEGGSYNIAGLIGFGASLKLLAQLGLTTTHSPIAERILALATIARHRLKELGAEILSPDESEHNSGIVTFKFDGADHAAIRRRCLEQHVALSTRGGGLRISIHAYNNEEDLERLIGALRV